MKHKLVNCLPASHSMRRTTLRFAKWVVSLNTVDGPTDSAFHRFVLSARLGLWPAIVLSTLAFGHLLHYGTAASTGLALNLCLVASIAFLFNDVRDVAIDAANNIHRWSIRSDADRRLFVFMFVLCATIVSLSGFWLSTIALFGTVAALLVSIAYSLVCKRLLLVGNLVAALLSLSPGLIIFLDAVLASEASPINVAATGMFLLLAFLLLLSREIKFDEFDLSGDRIGKRLTVPMLLGARTLNFIHMALVGSSIVLLTTCIAFAGKFSWSINFALAILVCAGTSKLLFKAYVGQSKESFYKSTRVVMLIIPLLIFVGF